MRTRSAPLSGNARAAAMEAHACAHTQERPSSKERELVFEAVTATMKQLKGSYSIISLISQARGGGRQSSANPKLTPLPRPACFLTK